MLQLIIPEPASLVVVSGPASFLIVSPGDGRRQFSLAALARMIIAQQLHRLTSGNTKMAVASKQ
jgi:hypothetical protein